METTTSLGEEIVYLPDEPVPVRRAGRRWRLAGKAAAVGVGAVVAWATTLLVFHGVRESRRERCNTRLKQVGLALHAYHEANGHFPAPALARRDGAPLLSWRVELLPYLGYRSLYERFRRDEAWDSPHNLALLGEMPAEFACPAGPRRREGRTGYLVVVGPKTDPTSVNTPFEPTRGVDFREMTDGTSATVLVLETDAFVPWTKPDDLRWSPGGPLPRLSTPHSGGAHALFADGATRLLRPTIDPGVLLAILTINGGEVSGG